MSEAKTPFRIIEDYLMDPMMYAGPERSLEALAALRTQLEEARGYRENAALWMADQDTRIEGLEARLAAKDAEAEELRAQLQAAVESGTAVVESQRKLIVGLMAERDAALQRAEKAEADARTIAQLNRELAGANQDSSAALAAARKALEEADRVILSLYSGPSDLRFNNDADLADFHQARIAAIERINGEGHEPTV